MASCRKDNSIWVSPKDNAILFRSTIYVRPSFDVFGHTNISTMRETFLIGKLGFLMGTFLFLKSSIILLAFFFYFSICFHVITNNLIMAIILFEKKMPCKSWCQPFNLGAHHYFDFKGMGVGSSFWRRILVMWTWRHRQFWIPVQFSEQSIIWNFTNTLMKNVK